MKKEKMKLQQKLFSFRLFVSIMCFIGIIFGGVMTFFFQDMFNAILANKMTLKEGTPAYQEWKHMKEPALLKMYLWHIMNPDEIVNEKAKPYLKEMGPYVFKEYMERVNIQPHPNHTLSFNQNRTWIFAPELSQGNSLADNITSLNIPVIMAQENTRGKYWDSFMLDSTFSMIDATLFVNKTVGELLFEGYEDTLLAIAEMAGATADSNVPMDRFGWFYARNQTTWGDGEFSMYTGENNPSQIGQISSWNHKTRTHYEGHCGEIRGSASGFFPPNIQSDTLELFSHEACTTLSFKSDHQTETLNGINGTIFELPVTTFANQTVHEPNWCYQNNLPSGVQNVTQCKGKKSPLFLSFPHFYGADEYYINQFDSRSNFSPTKCDHGSRMVMLKEMAIPLEFTLRLQLNIRIYPNPAISIMQDVVDTYIPAIWFEASGTVTEEVAGGLQQLLELPTIMTFCGLATLVLCMFGLLFSLVSFCHKKKRKDFDKVKTKFDDEKDDNSVCPDGCEMNLLYTNTKVQVCQA